MSWPRRYGRARLAERNAARRRVLAEALRRRGAA
jgi:hypothetical protein